MPNNEYDIEANMVCWSCANANLEKAIKFYHPELPKRPMCQKGSKSLLINDWDIPDPSAPIDEEGCKYIDQGFDLRDTEPYIKLKQKFNTNLFNRNS